MKLDRILFWSNTKWENVKASNDLKLELTKDFVAEFNKRPCCEEGPGSLHEFHSEVLNLYIKEKNNLIPKKIMSQKYQMKPGNVYSTALADYVGPDNITDEKAKLMLDRTPEMHVYFTVIPAEHKAKIDKAIAAAEAAAAKENPSEEQAAKVAAAEKAAADSEAAALKAAEDQKREEEIKARETAIAEKEAAMAKKEAELAEAAKAAKGKN